MANPSRETVPTEAIVQLSPEATPYKNTPVGKTTRTLIQNVVGAIPVVVGVLVLSDDVRNFILSQPEYGWLPLAFALAGALATYAQNTWESKVISDQQK